MHLHTPIRGIAPLVIFFTTLLTIETARGDVRLPAIFGDHMVLQQNQPIRIWGWAAPQEVVTVTMKDSKGIATADASGRWETKLAPMPASSDPTMITVQGTNKLEIKDVLVGEVWLCSGQSNMEWSVAASSNPQDEIAAANFPLIRHVKVPLTASPSPLEDFQAAWQVCSPETAAGFTACGYFMARHLHRELNVPIGLVNASWGGTRIEPWTPPVGFQKVDALQGIYQSVLGRTPGTPPYQERLAEQIRLVEAWTMKAKLALDAHQPVAPTPPYPPELAQFTSNQDPTISRSAARSGTKGNRIMTTGCSTSKRKRGSSADGVSFGARGISLFITSRSRRSVTVTPTRRRWQNSGRPKPPRSRSPIRAWW
jgi:sialate O-acetylesterase